MVFSAFRDPVDRLLSSFHYGIQFGGGRPGEVKKCKVSDGGVVEWQRRVVEARRAAAFQNNTSEYQELLRYYLANCREAVDNVYVQFLDPYSKDVNVALSNLERYVIVGMQSDLDGTVKRWANVTLQSCVDHPKLEAMRRILLSRDSPASSTAVFLRKSTTEVALDGDGATNEDDQVQDDGQDPRSTEASIELTPLDIASFKDDLQQIIREMTAGDEVIYERALEMYRDSQFH